MLLNMEYCRNRAAKFNASMNLSDCAYRLLRRKSLSNVGRSSSSGIRLLFRANSISSADNVRWMYSFSWGVSFPDIRARIIIIGTQKRVSQLIFSSSALMNSSADPLTSRTYWIVNISPCCGRPLSGSNFGTRAANLSSAVFMFSDDLMFN